MGKSNIIVTSLWLHGIQNRRNLCKIYAENTTEELSDNKM